MRYVESVALGAQDVPMWGAVPSFPWKEFTKALESALGTSELKLFDGKTEWKKGSEILSGMGRSPLQLAIEMSPLKGNLSLVFPSEDFPKLSSWTIHPEAGSKGFSDPYLQKGFFRFLCVQCLSIVNQMQVFQGLSPKIIDVPITKEDAYCIDIALEQRGETVWGRMICPASFQESFKQYYAQDWNFSTPSHLYQSIFIDLSLTVGTAQLTQETWINIQEGDFVILDRCSYYPRFKKGTFQLSIEDTPLFQTKVKEDAIKLLDYAHYFEEKPMDDENFEEPFNESMEEEVISAEEITEASMLSPKKVPVNLTVEVARIKMNLNKLLKLKPGNILELGVQPEKGVSLVTNGKCVGKGELLQIGDVIGVKITKLGE